MGPAVQTQNGLMKVLLMASDLINFLVPFVIALTVLVFVWGIFRYLTAQGDTDSRKEALGYITWGIVSLFVMVSVWGLVNILVSSFNLHNAMPQLPDVPDVRS
jgi:uncharacterized membrane protein YidH (DUF202 family)